MFYSPLRYPGGKNKLAAFVAKICIDNGISGHYVEPYAGGASVALFLLFEGFVDNITINDKDQSIYAFWYSVLFETDNLCELIEKTEINIENRNRLKRIQNNKENSTLLELGFSTLFLNRTNRDGIIKGGVIGGNDQNGAYKLDCRFNKSEIIRKIRLIASRKSNITLYCLDALDLIDKMEQESNNANTIFYFDPPYYLKASSLYMNYYQKNDHEEVANKIKKINKINWIVSYDNHPIIRELYSPFAKKEYTFNHSAHSSKIGQEILFFSKELLQPTVQKWSPIDFKLTKKSNSKKIQFIPSI
ncbi:DNA adenine methylase [Flavobacterium fluviale]|uniref:site-specific DNA-methyltransferase (adenine-specific) n=1 Tax=Flavobacterium fluviale TaxID=2249356 RepID=A0A344LUZ5_9FLAO|nr:DNA adenine methylase [Flavobacterium fluviale]AXB57737.1 DNA adenine methylase [Flavobacterium fluviale]